MVNLKQEVDSITGELMSFGEDKYRKRVEGPVGDFLLVLEDVVSTLRNSLLFMLVKVGH